MTESYVQYLTNHFAQTNPNEGSTHIATVETRYTSAPFRDRWLQVRLEKTGERVSICEYTKVTMIMSKGERTYFRIADGISEHVGETVSLADKNVDKCLSKIPPTVARATMSVRYGKRSSARSEPRKGEEFDQQWGVVSIPGASGAITVTLNSVWDENFTPIPVGTHRIMASDAPHDGRYTGFYVDYARKKGLVDIVADQVWFPIELAGSKGNSTRYVHIGNVSEGCVTVYALEHWNDIYNFLITHRLPGEQGKYVAMLEVSK
jgi:hypothetical protein